MAIAEFFDAKRGTVDNFEECSAFPFDMDGGGRGTLDPAIVERAENLLPALFEMIDPESPLDLMRFVNAVLGSAHWTARFAKAARRGPSVRQLKEGLAKMREALRVVSQTADRLPSLGSALKEVSGEFRFSGSGEGFAPDALEELALAIAVMELDLSMPGEAGQYVSRSNFSDAKPKLNSAEKAAYVCKRFNGPPVVTTPGSDFGYFTSLLHEIGTGNRDESMQGAIIRFKQGMMPSITAFANDEVPPDNSWAAEYHLRRSKIAVEIASQTTQTISLLALNRLAVWHLREAESLKRGLAARAAQVSLREGVANGPD